MGSDSFNADIFRSGLLSDFFREIFRSFSQCADNIFFSITHLPTDMTLLSDTAVEYFDLPANIIHHFGPVWIERIEESSRALFEESIRVDPGKYDSYVHDLVYRVKNKDGKYVTISCRGKLILDDTKSPVFFVATFINHEATETIDPVTGLYNRNNLLDTLKKYTHDNRPYYLVLTGILNFSEINRMYGYRFGNHVLKEVSELLLKSRKDAMVFRCEGVKTALVFDAERHDLKEIKEFFNDIRDMLYKSLYIKDIHIALDICGGAVMANDFSTDPNTIYNSALYALSVAKEEKQAELQVFENDLLNESNRRLEILNAIRTSIADNFEGFYLCYQPIADAETNQVGGMEALLRWRNKKYGVVPPNDFIPWLERDPIFFELGNWILRTAMHDTKKLIKKNPGFIVNVNLAYPQLQRSDFRTALNSIIKEEEFPAENLKLELTERCRLRDMNLLRNDMIFFKSSGMQTALDDFGTGYSALNLLTELPVDQVKIDRSFVINIEKDIPKQCLLRAITTCARELGKKVCVEGVETERMRDYLKNNFSVSYFQGYLYSKPIVFEEFLDWYINYNKTA